MKLKQLSYKRASLPSLLLPRGRIEGAVGQAPWHHWHGFHVPPARSGGYVQIHGLFDIDTLGLVERFLCSSGPKFISTRGLWRAETSSTLAQYIAETKDLLKQRGGDIGC
ncbi:hypothetical protein CMV_021891 [Castanea mollissima]|uniref:Uncharacterized protein n=1 Tax=Castanea mollissima TaxID=60419 RepID=A0A8J4QN74_9ROSI|nr:hypothetical protein CMV_021891 [Castanea mollissima]